MNPDAWPGRSSWVYRLTGDSWQLIALLLGLGLSGALWIDTEPVRPLR